VRPVVRNEGPLAIGSLQPEAIDCLWLVRDSGLGTRLVAGDDVVTSHQSLNQKSICTPIFMKRGVSTEVGASHACDPVVAAGLNDWL